jgi:CubicO group peptidase (beta-lactamase class C family)
MKWVNLALMISTGMALSLVANKNTSIFAHFPKSEASAMGAEPQSVPAFQEGQPGSSLFVPPTLERDYWPTAAWQTKILAEVGIDPRAIQRMEQYAFPPRTSGTDRTGVRTDGVVIIRDGYLVYEHYSGGYAAGKPHLIWSASKSVTNAMVGIALRKGLLSLDDPVYRYYPTLDRPDTRAITINHLLRMSSGLYANEGFESSPFGSTVNNMLFSLGSRDMGLFAASQPVIAQPDRHWEYSSLTSTLLMAVLKNTLDANTYATYPWVELFGRLGMRSAVWERDASGTFVGSSYVYLSPQDMARFGYLFLNDGLWDGQRILQEGWVRYSTTVAPAMKTTRLQAADLKEGTYGAQWWLNRAVPEWGLPKAFPDAPEDLFYASGHWGQAVFVIPSLDMVIVITADDRDDTFDWNQFLKLILEGVQKASNG